MTTGRATGAGSRTRRTPARTAAKPRTRSTRAKKPKLWAGLDLGGTKIQAAIFDAGYTAISTARRPTPQKGGPEAVVEELAAAIEDALTSDQIDVKSLGAVGIGSPGAVNAEEGTVAHAGNLPGFGDEPYPLAAELSKRLGGLPVGIGNDVSVATEAEYRLGAGRGAASLLGVFWGTGVGGGLILNGQEWTGRGSAGEFGHMVIKLGGIDYDHGLRGTVEAYAGRMAMQERARKKVKKGAKSDLFKIMKKRGRDRLTSSIWERAVRADDKLARQLLDEAAEAIGTGIGAAVNLMDVETVVLGGGLGIRLGPLYGKKIEKAMSKSLFQPKNPPNFRLAELGDLGGAIGAALRGPGAPIPVSETGTKTVG